MVNLNYPLRKETFVNSLLGPEVLGYSLTKKYEPFDKRKLSVEHTLK